MIILEQHENAFLVKIQDVENLKQDKEKWSQTSLQDEKTIKELGDHLSSAKLEIDSLKEQLKASKNPGSWMLDEAVQDCSLCRKEFSLSRRKVCRCSVVCHSWHGFKSR